MNAKKKKKKKFFLFFLGSRLVRNRFHVPPPFFPYLVERDYIFYCFFGFFLIFIFLFSFLLERVVLIGSASYCDFLLFSNWSFSLWLPHYERTLYPRNSLSPRLARPSALYRSHIKPEMGSSCRPSLTLSPFPPSSFFFF